MDGFSVSLTSFQVFVGLKRDLVHELGVTDTEIFYFSHLRYGGCLQGCVETPT
jgi:hypothetical protein